MLGILSMQKSWCLLFLINTENIKWSLQQYRIMKAILSLMGQVFTEIHKELCGFPQLSSPQGTSMRAAVSSVNETKPPWDQFKRGVCRSF
jgi:hypothetical protein